MSDEEDLINNLFKIQGWADRYISKDEILVAPSGLAASDTKTAMSPSIPGFLLVFHGGAQPPEDLPWPPEVSSRSSWIEDVHISDADENVGPSSMVRIDYTTTKNTGKVRVGHIAVNNETYKLWQGNGFEAEILNPFYEKNLAVELDAFAKFLGKELSKLPPPALAVALPAAIAVIAGIGVMAAEMPMGFPGLPHRYWQEVVEAQVELLEKDLVEHVN